MTRTREHEINSLDFLANKLCRKINCMQKVKEKYIAKFQLLIKSFLMV